MDQATAPPPPSAPPPPEPSPLLLAWPRSAQLALAFLLGLATALLAVQVIGSLRWGSRPADLDRGAGLSYRIDLNRADRAELLQLPGVGPTLAERIEDYRREHGAFRTVDELTKVRGIGPTAFQRLKPWVCVDQDDSEPEDAPFPVKKPPRTAVREPISAGMDGSTSKTAGKKEASLTTTLDINRAAADELQRLPGIGPKLSQRIIDERAKRPFKSVDDLKRVSGIGVKTLEKLRPFITVESEPVPLVTAE